MKSRKVLSKKDYVLPEDYLQLREELSADGAGGLSCQETCYLLPEYYVKDLDEATRAKVDAHLAECFWCRCKVSLVKVLLEEPKDFFSEEERRAGEWMAEEYERQLEAEERNKHRG